MKTYLFRCMWDDEPRIFYVPIEAANIREARKEFKRYMKAQGRAYCLLLTFREI